MNPPISPIGPAGQTYPVQRIQPINKDRQPQQKKKRKEPPPADAERDDDKPTIDEKV